MSAQSKVAAQLRPFWGRVTVIESGVDEAETSSGLVLPMQHEDDDGILRGVVLHCSDRTTFGLPSEAADLLPPGTVVYYSAMAALEVAGVVILQYGDVLAYEEESHGR